MSSQGADAPRAYPSAALLQAAERPPAPLPPSYAPAPHQAVQVPQGLLPTTPVCRVLGSSALPGACAPLCCLLSSFPHFTELRICSSQHLLKGDCFHNADSTLDQPHSPILILKKYETMVFFFWENGSFSETIFVEVCLKPPEGINRCQNQRFAPRWCDPSPCGWMGFREWMSGLGPLGGGLAVGPAWA